MEGGRKSVWIGGEMGGWMDGRMDRQSAWMESGREGWVDRRTGEGVSLGTEEHGVRAGTDEST